MAIVNTVASITTMIRGLIKDQIVSDGQNIFEYNTDNIFKISEPFIQSSSIIVYKNGTDITSSNWSYNADTNEVTISFSVSGEALIQGDIILITYNYYKKYSDAEIEQFLESSLAYFVQHKYCKIFELDDDDIIVAENSLNPTTEELYFIALIASILIDPQNIGLSTSDFKYNANRNLSDQEQIAQAFTQFKRFVGKN